MYTINGRHPGFGLTEQTLRNNDVVIWHYVNDYSYEVEDWFDDPNYPSLGDGTYYNRWLMAPDRAGAKGGGIPLGSNSGTSGSTAAGGDTAVPASNVSVETTAKNGAATVEVTTTKINEVISAVKKEGTKAIQIEPTIKGEASKVSVDIPKTSLNKIVSETEAVLNIKTGLGEMNIPNDTLGEITKLAGGKDVSMSMEKADTATLAKKISAALENIVNAVAEVFGVATPANTVTAEELSKMDTKNSVAVDFKITSGADTISSFGGKSIDVAVAVDKNKFTAGKTYLAYIFHDDGRIEKTGARVTGGNALVSMRSFSTVVITQEEVKTVSFSDVPEGKFYYDAVAWAVSNGITNGITDTTFEPNTVCNRAQMATMLYRFGKGADTDNNILSKFVDVASDSFYSKAVSWAVSKGISTGTSETTFDPSASCSRAQMVTMLYRYAKAAGIAKESAGNELRFTDVNANSYYYDAVAWAVSNGITNGISDTAFEPNTICSRAQMVTMLYRLSGLK
jgi:hypothetical protein